MTAFPLRIVTPDGLEYDGQAEEVIVRTTSGDLGILAGHLDCVAPLGMGRATVIIDGVRRYAACIGGILSVSGGKVTLVPTTFEWAEEIDAQRVEDSVSRAEKVLRSGNSSDTEIRLAEARLKRALVRKNVVSMR